MADTLPPGTTVLIMARIDRAKIRAALGTSWIGDPTEATFGGIELRVNPFVLEGFAAAVDRAGNMLGLIDLRGDHDTSVARDRGKEKR